MVACLSLPLGLAWEVSLQIPTQAGHLFQLDVGHRSDLKPATIPI